MPNAECRTDPGSRIRGFGIHFGIRHSSFVIDMRAAIVGAGIGGLAAALALQRAGWDVRVVEQAATPRELGFALALAPNALAAIEELGLRDAVVSRGVEVKTFEIRRLDGRVLKRIEMRGAAFQSIVLLRPALHGTLLAAVGADSLRLGHRVTSLADADAVLDADVVVGADGVASIVRKAMHPDEPPPRPSGYRALRGVSEGVTGALGDADAAAYLGDGVEIGFARASASAIYWYISLLDEDAEGDAASTLERCLRGLHAPAAAIARAATPGDMRLDRLFFRNPIDAWGRGWVTLLGDAAHPVLPHTAQGAALALEDAVALGLVLAKARNVESALRHYEQVRAARTRAIVRSGPRIAALTTTRSGARMALRGALIRLAPARLLAAAMSRLGRDPHRPLRG
jgi:2-polyprenyl-6-methoxyphenol hydroxylase-like FAD-dependent oxidoreductase